MASSRHWFETVAEAQRRAKKRLPKSVYMALVAGSEQGGCGFAQAAMGPFYCPRDQRIYLDTSFFREIEVRFHGCSGKACEFAEAYVIAHEIGHHVQKLLGIEAVVHRQQARDPAERNHLSVGLELQADCLAGVWGHSTEQRSIIDQADVQNGLRAAAAVGDDRIQKMQQGHVSPESFTHGSSKERSTWFRRGLQSGRIADCDTFAG